MITDTATIHAAIQSYAVMLNRSQWLAEDRLLMQETVWMRLVKRHPGRGTITIDHFEEAMTDLCANMAMNSVSVPTIVDFACNIAEFETDEVAHRYAAFESGGMIMLDEATRLLSDPNYTEADFDEAVQRVSKAISQSVLDDTEVSHMLAVIRVEAKRAKQKRPELAVETDADEADGVIAEWLGDG